MASSSSPLEEQKGFGKITRGKRVSEFRTRRPYDRPRKTTHDSCENPNNKKWLHKLILSPSRILASGAGKLISSVFSPSSSSSEEDSDDEYDDANDLAQGIDTMQEMIDKESQPVQWKKETKKLIEQLIMQETFSSGECDRLTRIITSRVVDLPIIGNTRDDNHKEQPDISNAVVMEAKKWLEDKRLGSTSNPGFDRRAGSLTPNMLPNVAEGEAGTPVDVAKSYMQARAPWASPSVTSPSPMGLQLFKEDPLSSSKDSLVSGSWNIQDEMRRVRSKATEEMLKKLPSERIDWSKDALGSKNIQSSAEKPDTRTSEGPLSHSVPVSELLGREHPMSNVVAGTRADVPANGVHTGVSSMPEFQDAEDNLKQPEEKNLNEAGVGVKACGVLSEAAVEVPDNNEQAGLVIVSQDSSSRQHEEHLQDSSQADAKASSPGNTGRTIRRSQRRRPNKKQ